jgi:hypothetical protein
MTLTTQIEKIIVRLEDEKDCYYEENHNQTDSHIMWLVGQIEAYDSVLKLIK